MKDPAVLKKVGPDWAKKALSPPTPALVAPVISAELNTLLEQITDGKRTSEATLDLLTVATLHRLPTESERKLILSKLQTSKNPKEVWRETAMMFLSTDEAKQRK